MTKADEIRRALTRNGKLHIATIAPLDDEAMTALVEERIQEMTARTPS